MPSALTIDGGDGDAWHNHLQAVTAAIAFAPAYATASRRRGDTIHRHFADAFRFYIPAGRAARLLTPLNAEIAGHARRVGDFFYRSRWLIA